MSKDTVKLFQRARAALQSEKAALSKTLAKAQATVADSEKKLAEQFGLDENDIIRLNANENPYGPWACLLYTSDAADE